MKDNEVVMIPFVAHESAMNRMERANKRLWIVIIVLIIGIFTYFLLPNEVIEDTNTQTVSEIEDSEIHQTIGE
jgi:hypothetical protein